MQLLRVRPMEQVIIAISMAVDLTIYQKSRVCHQNARSMKTKNIEEVDDIPLGYFDDHVWSVMEYITQT